MRSRTKLAAIVLAILIASCGGRPDVSVSIAGETVPTVLASATEGTGCSTSHGDAFPQNVPLTTIRAATPITLHFDAGQGASEIRGWIYDVAAPTASGGPNEEFTMAGRSGDYEVRSIVPNRTYRVLVNVRWSFLMTQGEVSHIFEMRVQP
ncbi:MAG: hypothetical protein AABM32_03575 [Chloroflexota bacterium]